MIARIAHGFNRGEKKTNNTNRFNGLTLPEDVTSINSFNGDHELFLYKTN